MEATKTGTQTSEYKLTLLAQVIGTGLIGTGFVTGQNDTSLTDALVMVIGGLISVYFGGAYIIGRSKIKAEAMKK